MKAMPPGAPFGDNDVVDDENHYFFQCQRFAAARQLFPTVFERARRHRAFC
jgi:hypothetical protein